MYQDFVNWDMLWQMVIATIAGLTLVWILRGTYESIKYRMIHGTWPEVQDNKWLSDEIDEDLQRMVDEGNPAIPGTSAYLSRQADIQSSQDMVDAYRRMNPW